jgi:hypothetical protein
MAGLFTTAVQAVTAIEIWKKEATQRCYTWNVQEMRSAYHDPEILEDADEPQMASENGRVCAHLENLDLLVPKFDRHLANKPTAPPPQRSGCCRRLLAGGEEDQQ